MAQNPTQRNHHDNNSVALPGLERKYANLGRLLRNARQVAANDSAESESITNHPASETGEGCHQVPRPGQ